MLRFPPFRLDPLNHCLWKDGAAGDSEPVELAPKTFDVLRFLVERAGRLVRHGELLDALWPGGDVQPEVLKGHILSIRVALGDEAQAPRFIETHRGRGYCFIASVGNGAPAHGAARVQAEAAPFVGREAELAALRSALDDACAGRPRMLFVHGEPGIGKTALVSRFASQAADRAQVLVATGRAIESHGTGEPYFPVFEAIASLIRQNGQERVVDTLLASAPSWMLQLPGLVSAERWADLQRKVGGVPRNRLLGEFCDFLDTLCADRTLLLILEDLHWADFSTIDLLKSVASRGSAARFLVIGTYRKEIASYRGHPVGELVQNLLPYAMCADLALPPLSEREVGMLIAPAQPEEASALAGFVGRQAGGNPLFVSLVLHHLAQNKAVERAGAGWSPRMPVGAMALDVPPTLASVLERQVREMRPDQQVLLECASIFGDAFDAAAVARLEQLDDTGVERELEALGRSSMFIAAGPIEYPEHGLPFRRYLFKHAVYRNAFYERQPPTARARRHLAAAQALLGPDADRLRLAPELARHFQAAGAWPQALDYLQLLLAQAKKRFARRDAMTVIERAEAILPRLHGAARDAQELAWLEEKAAILAANHHSAAPTAYAALVDKAAAQGQVEVEVRALLGLAFVHSWLDAAACIATLEQALQAGARQDDALQRTRTRISCLVWKTWVGGWDREAARECERLIAPVREAQDPTAAAWSMIEYAMLCLLSSHYREAQEAIGHSLAVLHRAAPGRVDHGSMRAAWMASLGIPWSDMLQGKLGMALERFDANIAMLEKNASPYSANMLRLTRAQLYIHAMDFQTAADECKVVMRSVDERMHAEEASSIATLPGERRTCEIMLGVAQAGQGRFKGALRRLLQVEQEILARPINFDWYRLLFLDWSLALAYLAQGDAANARVRAEAFVQRAGATDEQTWHALAWEVHAHVAMLNERVEDAAASIARAVDIAEACAVPLAAWRVYRTAAMIEAVRDDVARANRHAERFLEARQVLIDSLPPGHRLRATLGDVRLDVRPA